MNRFIFTILPVLFFTIKIEAQLREEFNGPFDSWANVKTRFKAKGDGKKDDTQALQTALDSLSCAPCNFNAKSPAAYSVIYLPKGRYKISGTLILRGKIGINIIGEDPANTVIEWAGSDNDTMMWTNGSAYYRISRLMFDAKNKTQIEGLGIHWMAKWKDQQSRSFASVNIEVSDCVFTGGINVGIGGGFKWNDSEVKIDRCYFNQCTSAGIQINGPNSLDYWIWNCQFINCNVAIGSKRGNFHAYNCLFSHSKTADMISDGGYYTSVRSCFSDNSKIFYLDKGSSSNPFKRTFQDNIVKQPQDLPIQYGHIGKITFFNNQFDQNVSATEFLKSAGANAKPTTGALPATIKYNSWYGANYNILSINNSYYYSSPFNVPNKFTKKNYVSNDSFGKKVAASATDFINKMPTTPSFVKRKVFEVPVNADADAVQNIINNAAELKGQRAVVHLPYGRYTLNHTIIIPETSDLQLEGDGLNNSTVITVAKTFLGSAIFIVRGPSYIKISDLQIGIGKIKGVNGIEFENVDQQKSMVLLDQIYSHADTTLFVDGLNYTHFEKNNSFFTDGNVIIGGDKQKAGKGTLSVNCFGGQFKGVTVLNNAPFVAKDCWWEGADRVPVSLQGDGLVSIDGAVMAPHKEDSLPTVKIGSFEGKISLMNMYVHGGLSMDGGNSKLKALFWNINFYYDMNVLRAVPDNFKGQVAFAGINAQCFDKEDPVCKAIRSINDKFVNVDNENAFVDEMTIADRLARPLLYTALPGGVSNIYITRVTIDGLKVGAKFSNNQKK